MMPITPTYPGVYIEEVQSGVRTITGVSTSIAAFFGRTKKGPINKAVRCLSYSDFLREFGGGHKDSDTGTSVKQFFGNGGTDCYVQILQTGLNCVARSHTETEPLQKKETHPDCGHTAPSIVNDVIGSSGRLLDSGTRRFMEDRLGFDFSRVQVHTDSKAAQ